MIADIGTQSRLTLKDVNNTCNWTNGLPWIMLDRKNTATQTIDKIKLNQQEKVLIHDKLLPLD